MKIEEENERWENLLRIYGAFGLEEKITKRASYRAYDRKYPFDSFTRPESLDGMEFFEPSDGYTPEEIEIAKEFVDEFLDDLTPREKEITLKLIEGYRPGEMAALAGKDHSNAERWLKWRVSQKMKKKKEAD